MAWITACAVDDIDPEDVLHFDHSGAKCAISRDPAGAFNATNGLCPTGW